MQARSQRQVIYGFSVYNASTGEAYLVELVPADQDVPDQLPNPTDEPDLRSVLRARGILENAHVLQHVDHRSGDGPRPVRPLRAPRHAAYDNLLSKTDELKLGYLYSLFDKQQQLRRI